MLAWLFRHFPTLRHFHGLPQIFDTVLLAGTLLFHRERLLPLQIIEKTLLSWPGVTTKIHRFGGTEFTLGRREIGHLHGNGLLDIPFTKPIRDQVVGAGLAQPHHIIPHSAWISLYIKSADDVPNALALLRRNYERWQALDASEKTAAPDVL